MAGLTSCALVQSPLLSSLLFSSLFSLLSTLYYYYYYYYCYYYYYLLLVLLFFFWFGFVHQSKGKERKGKRGGKEEDRIAEWQ